MQKHCACIPSTEPERVTVAACLAVCALNWGMNFGQNNTFNFQITYHILETMEHQDSSNAHKIWKVDFLRCIVRHDVSFFEVENVCHHLI